VLTVINLKLSSPMQRVLVDSEELLHVSTNNSLNRSDILTKNHMVSLIFRRSACSRSYYEVEKTHVNYSNICSFVPPTWCCHETYSVFNSE